MRSTTITGPRAAYATALLVVAMSLACASVFQREVRITADELQAKVEKAFPVKKRQTFVTMRFSEPQIQLSDGDRIGLTLTVDVDIPGGGTLHGRMGADGALAYRPDRGEIVIVDAQLTELQVDELSSTHSKALHGVARRVAQQYFAEIPVVRLNQGDFKQSLTRLVLKSVTVREGEVVATVGL